MSIEINIDPSGLQRAGADAEILATKLERSSEDFRILFEDAANAAKGSVHVITGKLRDSIRVQTEGGTLTSVVHLIASAEYARAEYNRGGSHSTFIEDAIRILDQGAQEIVANIVEKRL